MRGYRSHRIVEDRGVSGPVRGNPLGKTFFAFRGPLDLSAGYLYPTFNIYPTDILSLKARPDEQFTLIPWMPEDNVTEEELRIRKGTLAFVRSGDYGDWKTPVRLTSENCGRWKRGLQRAWCDRYLFRDKKEEFNDAIAKYGEVLVIPEVRIETDGEEVALIIGPDLTIDVPYSVRWEYEQTILRRKKLAESNDCLRQQTVIETDVSGISTDLAGEGPHYCCGDNIQEETRIS